MPEHPTENFSSAKKLPKMGNLESDQFSRLPDKDVRLEKIEDYERAENEIRMAERKLKLEEHKIKLAEYKKKSDLQKRLTLIQQSVQGISGIVILVSGILFISLGKPMGYYLMGIGVAASGFYVKEATEYVQSLSKEE